MSSVRVRFAPSPTGALHIGGARTALFNWLFARKHNGVFVLRIEDTDSDRSQEQAITWITDALKWLRLDWDEGPDIGGGHGPYFQSQRLGIYKQFADKLLSQRRAYPCFCSPEELAAKRDKLRSSGQIPRYDNSCREIGCDERNSRINSGESWALRLLVPSTGVTSVHDIIRGTVEFDNRLIDDLVIMKSDGWPTYNFACVIDDALMKITHVIRGEEHLSNTPKQILMLNALDLDAPLFAHVPMILAPDRSKLSKRHGATSVEEFRSLGYLPEALVNYLVLLGWSPADERELFSLGELPELFDLDRVAKTAAVYDVTKLTWLNGRYIRDYDLSALVEFVRKALKERDILVEDNSRLERVVSLMRSRARTVQELADGCAVFFAPITEYDEKGWRKHVNKKHVPDMLERAIETLSSLPEFNAPAVETAYRELADRLEINTSPLFHATRVATTGKTVGAGLFETMELLGKECCIARIKAVLDQVREA